LFWSPVGINLYPLEAEYSKRILVASDA